MTEYKKDYYTRTFIDMLTTLELELVRYEDGIGIRDVFDDESDFGERFDSAVDVVDYISEEIDDIRELYEEAILDYGLEDEWNEYCGGTFSYEAMLSFMDKNEDFKEDWVLLVYEPTEMLLKHLDDVDIDLALEIVNEQSMDYNKVFEEMLDVMEFELVKYDDGFGVIDLQGGNLGDIESDRFENAGQIMDRLDIYLEDYYFTDLDEAWEHEGYGEDSANVKPCSAEDWVGFMNEHKDFKKEYRHEYDVMNMIAYHDVDLNKGFENERSAEKSVKKEVIEHD